MHTFRQKHATQSWILLESSTLQKHLGYFNPTFRLSELHQCDQEMLLGRFS